MPRQVLAAVAAVIVARLAINGGIRVVYPFLPEIARGLGVSLATVSLLVALRSIIGLAAPLAARAAERWGSRNLMLAGLAATAGGSLLIAGARGLALAAAGFALVGAAKPLFDPPMQGWFGARVPHRRRSRVLGTVELTWALSLLATVPLSGVLIGAFGWPAPFVLVAALSAVGGVALTALIPSDRPVAPRPRPLRLTGERLRMLGVVLCYMVAAELLFVVYGAWLEDDLGLSIAAIGVFTLLVVVAELAGEGAVTAVGDRLGPRRMVFVGLAVSAVAYAGLGAVGGSAVLAVAAVVLWFVGFEASIVASIPLASELGGEGRERLLSLLVTMVAASRAIGALAGPPLYAWGGMLACGLVALGLNAVAAGLLRGIREPGTAPARAQ